MNIIYSDEMIEFLKRNSIYKEYNPKDYIKKVEMQKELGCIDDSLKAYLSVKPIDKRVKQYNMMQFSEEVLFGVVVCIKNTNEDYLRQMIESVLSQTYEKFTLYIIDRSDRSHAYIANVCTDYDDGRIVYRKLPQGQNVCWDYFVCDYIVLMNEIDALNKFALAECCKAINEKNADFIYADSGRFKRKKSAVVNCILRPDYAPVNLETFNYIGDFCVVKRLNLDLTREYILENVSNSAYEFIKEQISFAKNVVHIRKAIYLENSKKTGKLKVNRRYYTSQENPKVSIVINSTEDLKELSRIINSILMMTTYDNYEIVIVESTNSKADAGNLVYKYYKLLSSIKNIRFLRWKGEASLTKIYNYATTKIDGECIVFMDTSAEVSSYDWLQELLVYAVEDDCAIIAPKVYKGKSELVYAGAYHQMDGRSVVKYETDVCKDYVRNVTVASKYCIMISRSKFHQLGGFDEGFSNEAYIADLSLKAIKLGLQNVYTPYSSVRLLKIKPRGKGEDLRRFTTVWKEMLEYDAFREKY